MTHYLNTRDMEDVDDIRDMAQRVRNNGGEPNYAGEKIYRAFLLCLRLLNRLGYDRKDIDKAVDREWE